MVNDLISEEMLLKIIIYVVVRLFEEKVGVSQMVMSTSIHTFHHPFLSPEALCCTDGCQLFQR